MAHVELSGIRKSFGNVEVIPPLDLSIEPGEFIVLVGPSGCGKTTTLRMIAGLEAVTGGSITIAGRDVTMARPGERNCAMVFQNYALYPHMSVVQNIGYAMKVHGVPQPEIDKRISETAALLGLQPYLNRKPAALSGGQRQRVAIGRAIVRQPEVFLFDEPLSNLDAKLRVEMRAEIKILQRRLGTTAVYVTHDQVEAMTMADRVIVMNGGRIEQMAAPLTLYEQPANRFVANFIGSPAMNFFEVPVRNHAITLAGQELPLSPEAVQRLWGRQTVTFGIRPEHMREGPHSSPLSIVPLALEPLGAHTLIIGKVGEHKIVAQVDARFPAEPGMVCQVMIDMQQAHFFDPQTGQRL